MYVCSIYTQNYTTDFDENFKLCLEISEKFRKYSESRSKIHQVLFTILQSTTSG